jgi:hypothetical protein
MLAVKLVEFAGDGVAVNYAGGILANVSIETVGVGDLSINDAGDAENLNVSICKFPVATTTPGVYQIERKFLAGLYLDNSAGWQGTLGLADQID